MLGMVAPAFNPSPQEAEAEAEVGDLRVLHNENTSRNIFKSLQSSHHALVAFHAFPGYLSILNRFQPCFTLAAAEIAF